MENFWFLIIPCFCGVISNWCNASFLYHQKGSNYLSIFISKFFPQIFWDTGHISSGVFAVCGHLWLWHGGRRWLDWRNSHWFGEPVLQSTQSHLWTSYWVQPVSARASFMWHILWHQIKQNPYISFHSKTLSEGVIMPGGTVWSHQSCCQRCVKRMVWTALTSVQDVLLWQTKSSLARRCTWMRVKVSHTLGSLSVCTLDTTRVWGLCSCNTNLKKFLSTCLSRSMKLLHEQEALPSWVVTCSAVSFPQLFCFSPRLITGPLYVT